MSYKSLRVILGMIIVGFLIYLTDIHCLIRSIFKIPCPFCGMSRALIAIIHLDIDLALYYHPLFFLFPVFIILLALIITYPKNKKYEATAIVFAAVYFMAYLIRLNYYIIP